MLVLSSGWVNVTDLIFAKTEDTYHDLFPIKPNNERRHVLVGVFLELTFNIPPNDSGENVVFCLKVCLCVTRLFATLWVASVFQKWGNRLSFEDSQTYLGIFNSTTRRLVGSSLEFLFERADCKGWGNLSAVAIHGQKK